MSTSTLYRSVEGEKVAMAIYDNALKRWSAPCETRKVPTRHGETFVVASGDIHAPTLILLHGAGGNSSMWAADAGKYSRQFRVYAVDLPGEAGKSAANRPDWESPAFAEWLEDVMNALQIERATIVGLSQGAWAAMKFAVTMPQRVEKLVLMSPGGVVPDRVSFIFYAVGMRLLGTWGLRRMIHALFGDQPVPEGVEDMVAQISYHFKPRIGVLPIFPDEELRRLRMPTLLLGGTKDIMRDLSKISARLRDLLPNLTVTIIPGGGHALLNTSDFVMEFVTR